MKSDESVFNMCSIQLISAELLYVAIAPDLIPREP